jgi:hypothetical protein
LRGELAEVLAGYADAMASGAAAAETRRTSVSKVRQFLMWLVLMWLVLMWLVLMWLVLMWLVLMWLAQADVEGDPLRHASARDWAVRDYRCSAGAGDSEPGGRSKRRLWASTGCGGTPASRAGRCWREPSRMPSD